MKTEDSAPEYQPNVMVLTYRFEVPTTAAPGESLDTVLDYIRKNPTWPLVYLRSIEGQVVAPRIA